MKDDAAKSEVRELLDEELDEVSGGLPGYDVRGEAKREAHATCGGACKITFAWYSKELPKYCPKCGGPLALQSSL
ncbi:MAG: hypothetical protein ACOYD7_04970 [Raoultibacter sp.]|jgi:hypothetical protein